MPSSPKVALVHDYLIDFGGAEQVLLALHELYPTAPIYVSIIDRQGMGKFFSKFKDADLRPTWFNSLPFASKLISPFRFLLPLIWGSLDLSAYDVIIDSSSWAITRGFKRRPSQLEICYCHTPPRYLYGYDTSRSWQQKWWRPLIDLYALIVNHFMRLYDFAQAQKVDFFIANSRNTAARIHKYWHRDATIIYPPVAVPSLSAPSAVPRPSSASSSFFLTGGRLVAAKNFALIIQACNALHLPLKIFGSGVLAPELKQLAGPNVEFLGKVSDADLVSLYRQARGFIVAQADEDFGITLVEAQAAGCPVLAYHGGGYLETIIDGKTGMFFLELTVASLTSALRHFTTLPFDSRFIRHHAQQFATPVFKTKFAAFVSEKLSTISS